MRIYTPAGDLAFKTFKFSDGQPHFTLETYEREFDEVTIETAIKSVDDLFMVGLAVQVLRSAGYASIRLDVRYLLGARMDRAIDWAQPFTLKLVAQTLNSYGLTKVRILDVHSDVALKLIRNSENVLPYNAVDQVRTAIDSHIIVCPDKGAADRVCRLVMSRVIFCTKKRDMQTGVLSGFEVGNPSYVKDKNALILDDICDGGGTFVGLAKELRAKGAKTVNLFVTHGIFSKGLPLEGIDKIYTTDSYYQEGTIWCNGQPPIMLRVSMKEL